MEKAVEVHHVEYVAQKAKRKMKAKVKKEAEKRMIVEKEEKKKILEYI